MRKLPTSPENVSLPIIGRMDAFITRAFILLLGLVFCTSGYAVDRTWDGDTSTNFETVSNWSALPANNLTSDKAVFSSAVTLNLPTLTANRSIEGVSFTTATGGWSLNGAYTLTLGSGGVDSTNTSGTNTVNVDLSLAIRQHMVFGSWWNSYHRWDDRRRQGF